MTDDLKARLRNDVCLTSNLDWQEHVALANEAADAIERLERERDCGFQGARNKIESLRALLARALEALGPFGKEAEGWASEARDDDEVVIGDDLAHLDTAKFRVGDLRRARAVAKDIKEAIGE